MAETDRIPLRESDGAFVLLGSSQIPRTLSWLPALADRGLALVGIEDTPPSASRTWKPDITAPADNAARVLHRILSVTAGVPVRGVIPLSEKWVTTAALICEALNLPGMGLRAGWICRDKSLQRRVLGFCAPPTAIVAPGAALRLPGPFPCVVKPFDGWGSAGVVRVEDAEQASGAIARAGDRPMLIEHCVVGPEYTVETVVHDGRAVWRGTTAKVTNEATSRHYVELGHTVGATPDTASKTLAATDDEVISALRFGTGILHSEYRLEEGEPVLMETNARCPGDAIMTLHEIAEGRSLTSVLVDNALDASIGSAGRSTVARQIYFDHPVGRLVGVSCARDDVRVRCLDDEGWWQGSAGDEADLSRPRILDVAVAGRAGRMLEPITSSVARFATALLAGPDVSGLDSLEQDLRRALTISVESSS